MALDNISESVLQQARKEADHIGRAAQKNRQEKIRAARAKIEQEAERRYQAAIRQVQEEFSRKLIQRKGAWNKELLEKKNAQLQRIFEAAKTQILKAPPAQYAEVMRGLMEKASAGQGGTLRIHPGDAPYFDEILTQLNTKRPPETQITIENNRPLPQRGGFVFVSGGFEVDQTLDTLLEDIERELAPRIAAQLFAQ